MSVGKKINVIGDSHSYFWSGNKDVARTQWKNGINVPEPSGHKDFSIYHLGPCLAFNLNRYGSKNQGAEKVEYLIQQGILQIEAPLMCCFGEIDMRVYALRQGKHKMPQTVFLIAKNYMEFLEGLLKRDFRVICCGPIASQKDTWPIDIDFPRSGAERDRNLATAHFNEMLERFCVQHGALFFTLFYDTVDENLETKSSCISDGCHLSETLFADGYRRLLKKMTSNPFWPD